MKKVIFICVILVLVLGYLIIEVLETKEGEPKKDSSPIASEENKLDSGEVIQKEDVSTSTKTASDECGNALGNGDKIVFGQVSPNEWNPDNPFRSLTVHPNDPDTVLIGTEANGFVKSIDGGKTWTRLRYGLRHIESSSEELYPEVYDISFSKNNPDIIYAATLSSPGPLTGNYPSSAGGIYKSRDGGETWARKNCGLDNGWIWTVQVNPKNPDNLVIGVSGNEISYTGFDLEPNQYFDGGIYHSTNGGESWKRIKLGLNDNKNFYQHIKSVRDDPLVLYTFGYNYENSSQNIGFYKSLDFGRTWKSFAPEVRKRKITYFDISSDGNVIYAVDEMKIIKSIDAGKTWSEYELSSSGYPIAVFPDNSDRILFSKVDGVYLSEDGLKTETKVMDVEGVHPSDIAISPSSNNIVYAIDIGYTMYKSLDFGKTFRKIVNLREDVFSKIP